MTDLEHEQVFFEFVKQHDLLKHLSYSEQPLMNQEIIGLMVDDEDVEERYDEGYIPYYTSFIKPLLDDPDNAIIDPNWDNIYLNFINLDHNLDSIEYMKSLVAKATTRQDVVELVIELIIKKLIASNINAKKVYIVVHPHWRSDWLDKIIEAE
jgi:hypothetical protein